MTDELKLYVTECIQGRDGYDVMHELVISLARESSK